MTRTTRTPRRLWCAGEGATWRWHVATSREDAVAALRLPVRSATPDDCRHLWIDLRLHEKTGKQLEALFGVTRQAIDIWRAKGGDDLLRRSDALVDEADARLLPLLNTDKSATELALETGESVYTLRLVAKRNGIRLRNGVAKKPTDEEIIRLAEGRTWRELATVCHITLPTLRNYVYARPTLSAQVCARITRQTNGPASHGKVDPEEILRLHTQGLSRYAIAERLGVEQMTITHWLKKLDVRRGDS
jgi:hypothetical protein